MQRGALAGAFLQLLLCVVADGLLETMQERSLGSEQLRGTCTAALLS